MPESDCAETLHCVGGNGFDAHERQDLSYRYATTGDFLRFYGLPQPWTARAVVILLGDEPIALIGLSYGLDCATMFSESKPQIEPYMRSMTVLRAIKMAMRLAETCGRDVYAVKQEGATVLERLGFEQFDGEIYKWQSSRQRSPT